METTMSVRFAVILLLLTAAAQAQRADRPLPSTRPATTQATTQPVFEISIECEVPDLKDWSETLRPIVEKWYPIIVQTLPSEGYTAPRKFTITIKESDQIAFASGGRTVCGAKWFQAHPDDRDPVVNESVYIVQ